MFKVLTVKAPERHSVVFIVNFEQISNLFLVFFFVDFEQVNVSWKGVFRSLNF